jgi:hypothetical protein
LIDLLARSRAPDKQIPSGARRAGGECSLEPRRRFSAISAPSAVKKTAEYAEDAEKWLEVTKHGRTAMATKTRAKRGLSTNQVVRHLRHSRLVGRVVRARREIALAKESIAALYQVIRRLRHSRLVGRAEKLRPDLLSSLSSALGEMSCQIESIAAELRRVEAFESWLNSDD